MVVSSRESPKFKPVIEEIFERKVSSYCVVPMFDDAMQLKGLGILVKFHDPPICIPSRDEEFALQYFSPLMLRSVSVALSFERAKKHAEWLRRHSSVDSHQQYVMACALGRDVYSRISWLKKYIFIRLSSEEVRVHAVPPTSMKTRADAAGNPADEAATAEASPCLSRVEDGCRQL